MILGITGHQNLPHESIDYIAKGIQKVIHAHSPTVGVSSLAVGADQLFATLCLANSTSLQVVVPSKHYEQTFTTTVDLTNYHSLLAQAIRQEVLPFEQPSEEAFLQAGQRIVELADLLLAVWDGKGVQGKGGTADIVAYAQKQGKPVTVIWPKGVQR